MRGFRNKSDRLWDISIKTNLQNDNFIVPKTHSAICLKANITLYSNQETPPQKSNSNTKYFKYHHIAHPLQAIGNLAVCNAFQQDLDRLNMPLKNQSMNMILRKKQTKVDLAKYLHVVYMYLLVSTFVKVIANNNFSTWPGLTPQLILKHLPKFIFIYQGHLQSER